MIYSTCLETNTPVKAAMDLHLQCVQSSFPNEIIGVFLHGSQNYHLNTPESDVDTRALVLPTFEEIALNKAPVSQELCFDDGGRCVVRDVRLVFREFLKQNPDSLEILCTHYHILNEKYAGDFYPVLQHADQIARYDPRSFVKSLYGMICSNERKLSNTLSTAYDRGLKAPALTKPLSTVCRLVDMLDAYVNGKPFSFCLVPPDWPDLLRLKASPGVTARYIYENLVGCMEAARNLIAHADEEFSGVIDDRIPTFLDATLINLVGHAISADSTFKEAIK